MQSASESLEGLSKCGCGCVGVGRDAGGSAEGQELVVLDDDLLPVVLSTTDEMKGGNSQDVAPVE